MKPAFPFFVTMELWAIKSVSKVLKMDKLSCLTQQLSMEITMWPVSHECLCGSTFSFNTTEVTQFPWSLEENNLDLKFIFWIMDDLEKVITK